MLRKTFFLLGVLLLSSATAEGFKFPKDGEDNSEERARDAKVAEQLSTPCRNSIKNQKIMVLIAESRNGVINARQAQYNQHIHTINDGLKALGLKTYTQEQIRAQVAQAEIDAYFKNDPDAALSASKRMAANYVLRGLIETEASRNLVINVNQIHINMSFTLSGPDGRVISVANASNASYAGSNISGMALDLVRESAQEVVGQLYSDYCKKAGKR
jgi:hypothetical protein